MPQVQGFSLGRNRAKLLKQVRPIPLLNLQAFTDQSDISLWVKILERNDITKSINELIIIFDCKKCHLIIHVCLYWELQFNRIKTVQKLYDFKSYH